MLKFADAKPLGKRGLYWLKVHLANFAGKDKMSFDDRAQYVNDNRGFKGVAGGGRIKIEDARGSFWPWCR